MAKRARGRFLGLISRTDRLSIPPIVRPLAFGFAAMLSFASLGSERQERPHPKQSAVGIVAFASDPSLEKNVASFQSVDPLSTCPVNECILCANNYCHCISCDDGNPCTEDYCGNSYDTPCVHAPITKSRSCNDGNLCTINDSCSNGLCVGTPISCDDGNICTLDSCDPATGSCLHTPLDCDDRNTCTTDSCDPAIGCVHVTVTDGTSCDDGQVCTTNDTCTNSTCVGVPVPDGTTCGAFDPFCSATFLCETGGCVRFPCADFNLCTYDICDASTGLCYNPPIGCDDGSACTADSCDPAIGCVHTGLPEEAGPLGFTDQLTLQWGPALGASIYNTYRGTIPDGGLSGRSPLYDHVCLESGDAQLNGAQLSVDLEEPPVGASFYYLVDGEESSCGEGPLGKATDGTAETPAAFCPTPL